MPPYLCKTNGENQTSKADKLGTIFSPYVFMEILQMIPLVVHFI